MSLSDELIDAEVKKEFRLTDNRTEIWDSIFRNVRPVVKYRYGSPSKQIDIAGKLGSKYIERMKDAYKEYQDIEKEIQELEEKKQELKDKWQTENVKFHHLDKVMD